MTWLALSLYTASALLELYGVAQLGRRVRQLNRTLADRRPVDSYVHRDALSSGSVLLQNLDRLERVALTAGGSLRIVISGLVLGLAANIVSLFA
jgi:hypothetical protein